MTATDAASKTTGTLRQLACRITYLLAAPKDQPPAKVAVARKLSGA